MFTHLHLHTTYSLLDGQCQIAPLVEKAKSLGMKSLAVTDHGNLYALKSFYDTCRKAGIKPILGCEAYITHTGDMKYRGKDDRAHHLILHAKNLTGYHNLVKLISYAFIDGFYRHPRIDFELLKKYHEGIHCSSACIFGEVAYWLDNGPDGGNNPARAEEVARRYHELFGSDYSLEVMLHPSGKGEGGPADRSKGDLPAGAVEDFHQLYARQVHVNNAMFALGKKLGIRVVATNDVHFIERDDDDSHDVLLALSTGKKLSDSGRLIYTGQEYFKTEEEMRALFADHPEAIDATQEVADMVEEYELDSDPIMPKYPIPESFGTEEEYARKYDEAALRREFDKFDRFKGIEKVRRIKLEADYLKHLVYEGAHGRWGDPLPAEVKDRIDYELNVIKQMGFPGYFLIVHDYIDAARKMGVWVGPGRGSAAGAAVAYALKITNVDPLKYDLLFERFLNPDRISMPDIDVDFDDDGRAKVLEYVTQKYGQDHVAHIITFGQMAAKSVIKDVGRVMEYPLADTNKLASYVPETPKITFAKAQTESSDLAAAINSPDPTVHLLMERAMKLEGGMRQPGVHACGVIISRDPLIETLPVKPTEGESLLTTQYDGHFVEPVGLLKMDFLGLKTLTVEKECVELLKERGITLDPDQIPDDDPETYALFGRGETTGLFQFESDGMKKWLIALKPEKLTDLVAMNALYRPGPMEYIPAFVRRKQGEEPITYDHPLMEKYLKDTYGICVYQEQVMLLSRLLGGFSRGDSDKLRKAMGKKQIKVMESLKLQFEEGCLKNPEFRVGEFADEAKARALIDKIWNDWRAFASYAFNKSHAVCYAWVAYQTGYMKAHYPAEFMCAQISSEIGNFDKLPGFVAEAQEMNLKLMLPDVNESGARFVPTPDSKGIRYGLSGIKGVGAAGELIVEERRKHGPYKSFMDFCMRLAGTGAVNKRVLENLTRTGCFSSLEPNRGKLFGNIEKVLKKVQAKNRQTDDSQFTFFDVLNEGKAEVWTDDELADYPPFVPAEDLKAERELLGVYISGHPIQSCAKILKEINPHKLADLLTPEYFDAHLENQKVDNWRKKTHPKLKDKRGLKQLPIRLAGIVNSIVVKSGKPGPNGESGNKWAIVEVDDGSATTNVYVFAKCWQKFGEKIENCTDQLVYVAGEVGYRINYEKDDKVAKEHPTLGELNFTAREIYPLEDAMPFLSDALSIRLKYGSADCQDKAVKLAEAIRSNPGKLPVRLSLVRPDKVVVKVNTRNASRVAVTSSFLSALAKVVPSGDYTFSPNDKILLAPPLFDSAG